MDAIKRELEAIKDKELETKCPTKYSIIREFVDEYPNDQTLGRKIREYLLKIKLNNK
jgi:hypothetical protein